MDKIEKFLKRLTLKERKRIAKVLKNIENGEYKKIDIKKMRGYGNLYRVYTGNIRIIFTEQGSSRQIIAIMRRNEQTNSGF